METLSRESNQGLMGEKRKCYPLYHATLLLRSCWACLGMLSTAKRSNSQGQKASIELSYYCSQAYSLLRKVLE